MKSRLGFAVAVHVDPEILILDEVLAVGDMLFKRKCYSKMEDYFNSGGTILFVSHNTKSINALCSKAMFIDKGSKIIEGKPNTVTACYQKYSLLNNKDKNKYRDELISGIGLNQEYDNDLDDNFNEDYTTNKQEKDLHPDSYYEKNYISESTVKIKKYDVDIFDTNIKTLNGDKVNLLVGGESYIYTFKVRFGVDASNVSFGASIITTKGILVSQTSLRKMQKEIENIEIGKTYEVKWQFDCLLLPNTYFINVAVKGIVDNEPCILCKIKDESVFKVIEHKDLKCGGLINLNQKITYEKI